MDFPLSFVIYFFFMQFKGTLLWTPFYPQAASTSDSGTSVWDKLANTSMQGCQEEDITAIWSKLSTHNSSNTTWHLFTAALLDTDGASRKQYLQYTGLGVWWWWEKKHSTFLKVWSNITFTQIFLSSQCFCITVLSQNYHGFIIRLLHKKAAIFLHASFLLPVYLC